MREVYCDKKNDQTRATDRPKSGAEPQKATISFWISCWESTHTVQQ